MVSMLSELGRVKASGQTPEGNTCSRTILDACRRSTGFAGGSGMRPSFSKMTQEVHVHLNP